MGVRKYGNIFDIPMFLADYQPKWHIKVDKTRKYSWYYLDMKDREVG